VSGRRRALWIGGAVAVVFIALRAIPFAGANTGRGIDSLDYRAAAHLPLFSRAFLAGARPFGYPLYLKLVLHNEHAAVVGQLLLDTAAWLALAWMVARATRDGRLQVAGAVIVLAIGASFEAIEWDRIISSESLSTACGVGLFAAILWLRERWTVPRLVTIGVLAAAAAALRDSNGTFLGFVGVLLAIVVLVRWLPKRVLWLALIFVVVAALGSASASAGKRWEGPLKDVITLRILNSPERTQYFLQHGMPLTTDQIAAARGNCVVPAGPSACVVIDNPAFYRWIREHGRSTYTKSLAKFPATTLWEPVAHLRDSVGTRVKVELKFAADTEEKAPVSTVFDAVFFVRNPLALALWSIVMLALCVLALVAGWRGPFVLAGALVALTYPHLWLVWSGGALEVARHSLLASVQLRLGLWLSVLWLLDARLSPRAAASEVEPADQNVD
jgi:hypothetical protein